MILLPASLNCHSQSLSLPLLRVKPPTSSRSYASSITLCTAALRPGLGEPTLAGGLLLGAGLAAADGGPPLEAVTVTSADNVGYL